MKERVHSRAQRSVVLAAALVVLLAAALAGALTLAPAAAAAPDAAQLDAFLAQHGSPMAGTGATFIAEGQIHGVDPVFLVAIAGAETSFGKLLYSENGDQCTYNAFNWFYGPTWPTSDFTSWDEAIARVAEGLGGPLYHGAGLYSVDAIAPKYCPDGTEQWVANVKAFMMRARRQPGRHARRRRRRRRPPSPTPPSAEPGPGRAQRLGQARRRRPRGRPAHLRLVHADQHRRPAARARGHPPRHPRPRPRRCATWSPTQPLTLAAGQSSRSRPRGRSTWPAAGTAGSRSRGTARPASSATSRRSGSGSGCPRTSSCDRWEQRDSALSQAL